MKYTYCPSDVETIFGTFLLQLVVLLDRLQYIQIAISLVKTDFNKGLVDEPRLSWNKVMLLRLRTWRLIFFKQNTTALGIQGVAKQIQ